MQEQIHISECSAVTTHYLPRKRRRDRSETKQAEDSNTDTLSFSGSTTQRARTLTQGILSHEAILPSGVGKPERRHHDQGLGGFHG